MHIINKKHFDLSNRKKEFLKALPFPYLIIDDFLDKDFFSELTMKINNIPKATGGRTFNSDVEHKKWISKNSTLPNVVKTIVNELHSEDWVENIRILTGINSLVTTTHGNTELANYHVMDPGSILGPHVDHSFEPIKGIPHILNVIIYLTDEWDEKDGGSTLLYDKTGRNIISRVTYKKNRAVIFLHTPYSFHSVERVNDNAKNDRRTIYVDYYSESFQPYDNFSLNFSSKWFKHGTTFKLNNYFDYFKLKNKNYTKGLLKYYFYKFLS